MSEGEIFVMLCGGGIVLTFVVGCIMCMIPSRKTEPKFKVTNNTSSNCAIKVTSMGPSEYHITLSDAEDRKDGRLMPNIPNCI